MLWLSFGVVHHADYLAVKLGEPYGTLILPLSVISKRGDAAHRSRMSLKLIGLGFLLNRFRSTYRASRG